MEEGGTAARPPGSTADPRALWGHVYRLESVLGDASDVDAVARGTLAHLVALPGVSRAGIALTEGAGRRLRFLSLGRGADAREPWWCLIDAYDDVPLTRVVRTGEPVLGSLDRLEQRYAGVVARQRAAGNRALAAVPLPGVGSPTGGFVLFFDTEQTFLPVQRLVLDEAARRIAEALRRVQVAGSAEAGRVEPEDPGDGQRATLRLEHDPRSAGVARRFLRETLTGWGVDDDAIDSAQLCVSELVNNVIMHARTSAELTVHVDGSLLGVEVRDHGRRTAADEPAPAPDPLPVFGRGLTLVDAVADRWGSEQDASGTLAWFVLELDRAEPARTG